jgi:hypothetical protein
MNEKSGFIAFHFLMWALLQFSTVDLHAQNTALEFWPETDIWYRLSPAFRLSAFIPITKYNETKYRDLNVYLQGDYAWGKTRIPFTERLMDELRAQNMKSWMTRAGFMEGWSLGENAGAYSEDQLYAELHRRVPIKGNFLISQRLRNDFRWLGDDNTFSYRLRYRLMVEKEYGSGKASWVPYTSVEPTFDSRYSTVISRLRVIGGTTFSTGKALFFEGNITYQYDSHYDAENMFALNLILHVYFESKKSKQLSEKK